jgi:Galactose oxidase, central domain
VAMVAALAVTGVGTGLATQGPLLMTRPVTAWPPAKAQLLAYLQQEMDAARAHPRPRPTPQAPPHQPDPARQAGIDNDLHTGPFSAAEFAVRNLWQGPVGTATNYGWTRRSPATVPPPRQAASMAYDAAVGKVVLFGGLGLSNLLNDTWLWDGRTWIQQKPAVSPPARASAGMAYDAARGKLVLFGGGMTSSRSAPIVAHLLHTAPSYLAGRCAAGV